MSPVIRLGGLRFCVDNSQALTSLSLCAGYGGIDLGLKRVIPALRVIAYSEIEAFAIANLVAKMEAGLLDVAPVWSNLKTFPWASFRGRIWIITGGYPCQPFSAAGLRLGKDDPRHLWPYILDGVRIILPEFCFFENVEGHITLGLSTVISDLEEAGYRVEVGIFSAAEIGAGHQRKRVFILAHRIGARLERYAGYVDGAGREGHGSRRSTGQGCVRDPWPSRPGEPQHEWEPPRTRAQSALGRDADGTADRLDYAELCSSSDNRTDELRLLGNGVAPTCAELAFVTLFGKHLGR
jgi:site-specific DNA-cytosine methylase